ncbi:MAG: hypothetical protein RI958_67 [Actinomycetota bacterium]
MLRHSRPVDEHERSGRLVLDRSGIPARAQVSAVDPAMAHVTVLDGSLVPSADHWRRWMGAVADAGYSRVRTGALTSRQAEQASRAELAVVQELVLLELVLAERPGRNRPGTARPGTGRTASKRPGTKRLGTRRWDQVAAIDREAFGPRWCLDATMLDDITSATPEHRARFVGGSGSRNADGMVGFLLSGGADRTGYVQRLAVSPAAQRQGVAVRLLTDALAWMHRSRMNRVYVNTDVDNSAALDLYRRFGFEELPERLRVFEGAVA